MKKGTLSSIANYTFKLIILLLIFGGIYLCFYFWSNQKNFLNDLACKNIENYQDYIQCNYNECYEYNIFYSPVTNSCIVSYAAKGKYKQDSNKTGYMFDEYYIFEELNGDSLRRGVEFNTWTDNSEGSGCNIFWEFPMYKKFDKNKCDNWGLIMAAYVIEGDYLSNKLPKGNKIKIFYK